MRSKRTLWYASHPLEAQKISLRVPPAEFEGAFVTLVKVVDILSVYRPRTCDESAGTGTEKHDLPATRDRTEAIQQR